MVTALDPPMVPVTEPKFAPLLGLPLIVVGIVVLLPEPLCTDIWSRLLNADC